MDLQILSKAQEALEAFQEVVYDLKDKVLKGTYESKILVSEYMTESQKLGSSLRSAVRSSEDISKTERRINMNELSRKVSECAEISETDLLSFKGKKREYAVARQVHMAMLHKGFKVNQQVCGDIYELNHATALHSCKIIKNLYETDKLFRQQYGSVITFCLEIEGIGDNISEYLGIK